MYGHSANVLLTATFRGRSSSQPGLKQIYAVKIYGVKRVGLQ